MFDKFTEGAIKVIMLAQEEARRLRHNSIGTELILVALVLEHRGLAAKALKSAGLSSDKVRVEVEKIIGRGSGFCAVEIPFTPRAKEVVERASLKAEELGDHQIETEHLLLSLLDEEKGFGIQALENSDLDRMSLKQDVLDLREKRNVALKESKPFTF
jgi:ATP-dependent Clp protease ATP-binding subunit ClpC